MPFNQFRNEVLGNIFISDDDDVERYKATHYTLRNTSRLIKYSRFNYKHHD